MEQLPTGVGAADFTERSQICAVIVSYNIAEAIHRCVESIRGQVGHVLIVDNGSEDVTRRELQFYATSDSVTFILNERNEGIAHAFNQAVQWARDKTFLWLLTLDHDSEATPDMVQRLANAWSALNREGIENVGLVAANPYDRTLKSFQFYRTRKNDGPAIEVEDAISSGCLIPLRVFNVIGNFNEDLFIYYVDTDFCIRLSQGGFRVFVCPEAVLLHREGNKECRKVLWFRSYFDNYGHAARYYITRNTIYVIKRLPLSSMHIYWIIRRNCVDHLMILLFDKERFSKFRFSIRGLLDGLRGRMGPMSLAAPYKSKRSQKSIA